MSVADLKKSSSSSSLLVPPLTVCQIQLEKFSESTFVQSDTLFFLSWHVSILYLLPSEKCCSIRISDLILVLGQLYRNIYIYKHTHEVRTNRNTIKRYHILLCLSQLKIYKYISTFFLFCNKTVLYRLLADKKKNREKEKKRARNLMLPCVHKTTEMLMVERSSRLKSRKPFWNRAIAR